MVVCPRPLERHPMTSLGLNERDQQVCPFEDAGPTLPKSFSDEEGRFLPCADVSRFARPR